MPKKKTTDARIEDFKRWIVARGAELLVTTNEWEAVRFRSGTTTSIVYLNKKRQLSFTGQATAAWAAFTDRSDFRFIENTPRPRTDSVVLRTLLARDGDRCFYCGGKFHDVVGPPTREHLVPRTAGGPDHISNLFLACQPCNTEVGHMSAPEKIRFRDMKRRGAGTVLLIDLRPLVVERAGLPGDPIREDLIQRIDAIIHHQPQKESTNG